MKFYTEEQINQVFEGKNPAEEGIRAAKKDAADAKDEWEYEFIQAMKNAISEVINDIYGPTLHEGYHPSRQELTKAIKSATDQALEDVD